MSNDAQIKKFRKAVETKRAALGNKPKVAYTTNALLEINGDRVNLNTLSTEARCVEVARDLLMVESFTVEANEALDTNVSATIGGFTITQWVEDIKLRVRLIAWERDKKKLNAMDKQLQELMSEGARTADAIANIAAQLED